jgi:hypothetical protein
VVVVEILVTRECPCEDAAVELVGIAARELGMKPQVMLVEISDLAVAESHRFAGSPTIRVNGVDIAPLPSHAPALACRYDPRGGPGMPTLDRIRSAMATAASRP